MSTRRIDMDRLQELVRLHRMGTGAREAAHLLRMGPNTERDTTARRSSWSEGWRSRLTGPDAPAGPNWARWCGRPGRTDTELGGCGGADRGGRTP